MKHFCQKDFAHIAYGDATVAENGCAVCSLAMVLDSHPEHIVSIWENRYWDDDFGTLPHALSCMEQDFGIVARHMDIDAVPHCLCDGTYILLVEDEQGMHYEVIHRDGDSILHHDSRAPHATPIPEPAALARFESSEKLWHVLI